MVISVTQALNPKARREIDQILATVTGPRTEITLEPNGVMLIDIVWAIRNIGESAGMGGLRLNLQVDGFFGDSSQLIIEADGTFVGSLSGSVISVLGNSPAVIPAGGQTQFFYTIRIPSSAIFDRQGAVNGFSWWVAEVTARDTEKDQLVGGDSRFEIRDWFRILPSALGPSILEVTDNAGFAANQV